ncbi:MAG: potassium-transporting ATPase subunit KdpA [Candidatus Sericytochromatia bacterium]|nr:potassium-transporting ATPase subunit KdpA [Candidatus Sericytochromatia bacterium]
MLIKSVAEIAFFFIILLALVKPFGNFMYKVFNGDKTFLTPLLSIPEKIIYKISGVDTEEDQSWKKYFGGVILINLIGIIFLILVQMFQAILPLNTQNLPNTSFHLALNTAVSFVTNTNWQSYVPEATMSYFTQMLGLTVQNFLSAATGMIVLVALIRGFVRKESKHLGNCWVDLTRCVLYILLPISIVSAVFFISQGVPNNFNQYTDATTIEGAKQFISQGPMASQEAIKMIGTNGGGFLNANSAHPFENPSPLTNFFQMLMMALIPASLTYTFGKMVNNTKQGWAILTAMLIVLISITGVITYSEFAPNTLISHISDIDPNNQFNFEGKETRFGITQSTLFAGLTTSISAGAVNSMHDSYSPLGGMLTMFNIELGEVILGGTGTGLYIMLLFAILTVFIAGLMVGRTPEYLGKKIGPIEMQSVVLGVLAPSIFILVLTAIASIIPQGTSALNNAGAHGFSEILYAYSSAAGNNGSAFAGLSANTVFWNLTLTLAMFGGRFIPIFFVMRLAGSLVEKKYIPTSVGTFPTTGLTFVILLIGVVIIVGGLTFFPALTLSGVAEHFQLLSGKAF